MHPTIELTMKSLKKDLLAQCHAQAAVIRDRDEEIGRLKAEIEALKASNLAPEATQVPAQTTEPLRTPFLVRGNPSGVTAKATQFAWRLGAGAFVKGYTLNGTERFWVQRAPVARPELKNRRFSAEEMARLCNV